MTLIELIFFIILGSSAAYFADKGYSLYGYVGALAGLIAGVLLPTLAIHFLRRLFPSPYPLGAFPVCPGCHTDKGYSYTARKDYLKCGCGLEFFRDHGRRRFMAVDRQGNLVPYKIYDREKGWVDDSGLTTQE